MKPDSRIGYIFNKYEIIYILRTMGSNFLFDYSLKSNLPAQEIAKRAEKSLIEKNYIFNDFFGNLVLSKEITEYFRSIASPESVIVCKKYIDGCEHKLMFFIKNKTYVTVETDSSNKENYILTYISDCKKIFNDMVLFSETDKSGFRGANDKFAITPSQYKLIKNVLMENDETSFKLLISDFEIREEVIDEIKNIFLENADILTFSLCSNCKNKKTDYFVYYLTEEYIWAVIPNTYGNENIRISSVTVEDIYNRISGILRDKFNIMSDSLQNLFD